MFQSIAFFNERIEKFTTNSHCKPGCYIKNIHFRQSQGIISNNAQDKKKYLTIWINISNASPIIKYTFELCGRRCKWV